MRAGQIAENIINGNLSDAREAMLAGRDRAFAMCRALDVVEELVDMIPRNDDNEDAWADAIDRVRRLLG